MAKRIFPALGAVPLVAALAAHADYPSVAIGKQRAAVSKIEWEIREAGHPVLGNVRFGYMKTPVETPVGNAKVYSRAYLSCQKGYGKLAIELTNAIGPDDPGGLKSAAEPRLICTRPMTPFDEKLVQEDLLANFSYNKIGDALSRLFRPFPLRECVSIRVVQDVVLPAGWARKTQRIEYDILPYDKELDSVFVTCGEESAYGVAPATRLAAAPKAGATPQPAPAPPRVATTAPPKVPPAPPPKIAAPPAASPAPSVRTDLTWQMARVPWNGKTNMRNGPGLQAAIVVQLDPGAVVLVQKTANDWWKAKTSNGKFEGYIREDRLVFK
jgi:hypothetical protein